MITKKVELAERKEPRYEYEAHKEYGEQIRVSFQSSLRTFKKVSYGDIKPVTEVSMCRNRDVGDIPYGPNTTIGKSGCAICALKHALDATGVNVEIAELAEEAYQKGYLCEEYKEEDGLWKIKGTYHSLFDLYKNGFCIRAKEYQQIFGTLQSGKIVTLLVSNNKYHNDPKREGAHFINIVGKQGDSFIIEDNTEDERVTKDCLTVLKSTNVAWLWI